MYGYSGNYQYYPQQRPQATFYKGRPVMSEEEVRNTVIDLDGQINIFPDMGHQCIYTKHVDMSGMPVIQKYVLEPAPAIPSSMPQYEELKKEIEMIKKQIGVTNNESDAVL